MQPGHSGLAMRGLALRLAVCYLGAPLPRAFMLWIVSATDKTAFSILVISRRWSEPAQPGSSTRLVDPEVPVGISTGGDERLTPRTLQKRHPALQYKLTSSSRTTEAAQVLTVSSIRVSPAVLQAGCHSHNMCKVNKPPDQHKRPQQPRGPHLHRVNLNLLRTNEEGARKKSQLTRPDSRIEFWSWSCMAAAGRCCKSDATSWLHCCTK